MSAAIRSSRYAPPTHARSRYRSRRCQGPPRDRGQRGETCFVDPLANVGRNFQHFRRRTHRLPITLTQGYG